MPVIRHPDGRIEQTESYNFCHRVTDNISCLLTLGTACPHGYRFDRDYTPMPGDGLPILATDMEYRGHGREDASRIASRFALLPGRSRAVEVCLLDGRVVAAMATRAKIREPDTVTLDVGGAERAELPGHPWARRLVHPIVVERANADAAPMAADLKLMLVGVEQREHIERWRRDTKTLFATPVEHWDTPPLALMVSAALLSLHQSRNTVQALEERWRAACEADAADVAELALLRKQADGDMRRLNSMATSLESANTEIVRLNGCLNDALRDVAEVQASNDRLRRIIFGHEIGEASLTKQLDEARRALDEVHTRYRPQLQRADDTIKTLREDLAEANKRRPPRWPGLRASLLRRFGL